MPAVHPKPPRFAAASENTVYRALRDQLRDHDLIIVGQRVTDRCREHEADFVVAIAGAGIVCVEVKGGEVGHSHDGWWQYGGGSFKKIDPVRQARDTCYALRDFVEHHPCWTQGRLRWDHVVVLPYTELPSDFAVPDCPRWKVVDRTDMPHLASRLWEVLTGQEVELPPLNRAGIKQLRGALGGWGPPRRDVVTRALANDDAGDELTRQQAMILRTTRLVNRVQVFGSAGSGKTFLAVEQARLLTAARQRVALVCYSRGLATYLKRSTEEWSRRERPAYVGQLHALGLDGDASAEPDASLRALESQRYWEQDLPRRMRRLAQALDPDEKFDAIVVDEAQDFADDWWYPLLAILRDPEIGGLYAFSDLGQRVFDRQGTPPVPLVPLVLDRNLRNTRQIAATFRPLVEHPIELRGGDGPEVTFVACSAAEALEVGDEQVEQLLAAGWRPEDVALLTTGHRHPEQVALQERGNDAYWGSFWDAELVFYGHVLGFKGLERRAVVLVVNEHDGYHRSRERLYVGLSRARDQLVVCGDPDFIAAVGGPDLARRMCG